MIYEELLLGDHQDGVNHWVECGKVIDSERFTCGISPCLTPISP